jgi:type II secretory pathway predicted ATPase ExeA
MSDIITWFGFKWHPFDKGIKTSAALDTKALKECTARLNFMRQRGGVMLLTGDPGVGKTLALRHFADSLNEARYRTIYTPLTTLQGADLLRHISSLLGLPNRASKATLFSQIQQEVLDSHTQKGRTLVIIIDEAQLLKTAPLQELRLLTNFKMDSMDPFIMVLAGQTELKRIFEYAVMEPFAQRLAMRYHMPSLAPDETAAYINHHMKIAGAREPIFHNDALRAIHETAFGLPRRIGTTAIQALTYAVFAQSRTIDADLVLRASNGQ